MSPSSIQSALLVVGVLAAGGAEASPASTAPHATPVHDVVLRHARVLDGSGNPWFRADVAIDGERIAAIGDLGTARAAMEFDLSGLYLAPGSIDTHSHAGPGLATAELSAAEPLLTQGITTVFVNPDGRGPVDLDAQRADLERDGLGVNVARFVPHGSVREAVVGHADRAASAAELGTMRDLVRAGMEAGAFGLSSGVFYAPGSYADTNELVALARVAAAHGGAYQSHVRDESDYSVGVLAAAEEVITVAREAGLPGIHTHVKALGPNVWGASAALIERIEAARAEGVEIYADQYPYLASSTSLGAALLPRWAQAGGETALLERLASEADARRIRAAMVENLARRGGAERIRFRRVPWDESLEGRSLAEVAAQREQAPVDAARAILARGGAGIVSFNMREDDVHAFMRRPWTMTASDGGLVPFGEGVPHPRGYGTFPRRVRAFVLDAPVTGLEDAIRSMTSLPAQVYGLHDRGRIAVGAVADLVAFDLDALRDRATFGAPHQLSEGVRLVLVSGRPALRDGRVVAERHGRVLDHGPDDGPAPGADGDTR